MLRGKIKSTYRKIRRLAERRAVTQLLLLGRQMSWNAAQLPPNTDLRKVGFKVFSQWDEDGIIQYLINKVPVGSKTFIEFGVGSYEESNTRFLLMNNNWQGMVLDSSIEEVRYIRSDPIYWQYDLTADQAWITRENINELLSQAGFGSDLGLLSIDVDGNDYWIWEAVQSVSPRIVIVEYNSLFGLHPVSVPYSRDFDRTRAHVSNLYFGCSLAALHHLARKKGYVFVGSDIAGHDAFFVRSDVAGALRDVEPADVFVPSGVKESRDRRGSFTYVRGDERVKLIEHLPVVDVITGEQGPLNQFRD